MLHVLTREMDTAYYRSGFRCGFGGAKAVMFPSTLVEQWKVLQVAVDAGCAIMMQAAKYWLDWRYFSEWLQPRTRRGDLLKSAVIEIQFL